MPTWSSDGTEIFYIDTVREEGRWAGEDYALDVPRLVRTKADGSGEPEILKSGKFTKGKNTYAYWIRQPVVSPDGSQVAVISDAPNPDDKTLTVQFYGMEIGQDHGPRAGDERQPRPPGSRVAAGRQVPRLRQERPGRLAWGAGDHALQHRDREGRPADRSSATCTRPTRATASTWPRPAPRPSGPTSSSSTRARARSSCA